MTPSDLDLIEAAAQAAGYTTRRLPPLGMTARAPAGNVPIARPEDARIEATRPGDPTVPFWNPLDDQGQNDALADHFGIRTWCTAGGEAWAEIYEPDEAQPYGRFAEAIHPAGEDARAVRRVVVRAAAHLVRPDENRIGGSEPL